MAGQPGDVSTTDTGETEYSTPRNGAEVASGHGEVSRLEIEPAKNGGFVAKCFYKSSNKKGGGPDYMEPDVHAFASVADLVGFLTQEFGGAGSDMQAETAGPPQGAPAPMPPPPGT